MSKITIYIRGARSGEAQYTFEMDEGEVMLLKLGLMDKEQKYLKSLKENKQI